MAKLFGERVEAAVALVGVSPNRVRKIVGQVCETGECWEGEMVRNQLELWAKRVFSKGPRGMRGYLETMLREWSEDE